MMNPQITADAIYWKAGVNGTSYAIEQNSHVAQPHFEWDFGFRIGCDYILCHDAWNLRLNWTHLHTNAHAKIAASKKHLLFPIWATSQGTITDAFIHWRLHLGIIDLDLGRSLNIGSFLFLMPTLGVRTAIVRQKDNILYRGGTLFPDSQDKIRMKNKYWGVGPKMGIDGNAFLGKGLSLYFNGALSLLAGECYLHQNEDVLHESDHRLGVHNLYLLGCVIWDLGFGPQWQYRNFTLKILYESHLFFNQNQFAHFTNNQSGLFLSTQGDLFLKGYTLDLNYVF